MDSELADTGATLILGRSQIAERLMQMWVLLRSALGPELREETYIVFHEVDPKAYGRGGLTRAERDGRRQAEGV